jgi:hypothetical protein
LVAINPLTGQPTASVTMENSTGTFSVTPKPPEPPGCPFSPQGGGVESSSQPTPPSVGSLMIAGDGYAYVPYLYYTAVGASGGGTWVPPDPPTDDYCELKSSSYSTTTWHLRLMRLGPTGDSYEIPLGDWDSYTANGSSASTYISNVSLITNADQGVLVSYEVDTYPNSGSMTSAFYLATTSGPSITSNTQVAPVLGETAPVQPILQRQDGNFVGTVSSSAGNFMVGFTPSGGTLFTVPNDTPQIATSDNGVIGTSGIAYDQSGNVDGYISTQTTFSWLENGYEGAALVNSLPPDYASTFAALPQGNPSATGTSVQQSPYPRLKSCFQPNGASTCPYDYLLVALEALQSTVAGNCPDCVSTIFQKLNSATWGIDQPQFSKFISRYPPGFFDGTRSTLLLSKTCEPSVGPLPSLGIGSNFDATFGCVNNYLQYGAGFTVANYFAQTPGIVALAVLQGVNAQNPQGQKGLLIFFNPSSIYTTIPQPAYGIQTASIFPNSNGTLTDGQVANASTLFHEALHEYYDYFDNQIQGDFGLVPGNCTANISDYISCEIFNRCRIDHGCNQINAHPH